MEILGGEIKTNELSKNAFGGSELMVRKLAEKVKPELLAECQIIATRVRELDETKIRILWIHDLVNDPECHHLKNGGWRKFHKIVFVSNWQAQQFIYNYGIPWSHCVVMLNAIDSFPQKPVGNPSVDPISLVYHTTPHRGLEILIPVFEKLLEKYPNLHLNVCSSFNAYGWPDRDKPYEKLFDKITKHEKMTYHGFVNNAEVREIVSNSDIFAYPSIWMETSCISLMEAMSAGLVCVHPNLGALYETAANWTSMYQWSEDTPTHASVFHGVLDHTVQSLLESREAVENHVKTQKSYADIFYSWNVRELQWSNLIKSLMDKSRELPKQSGQLFSYSTTGG